MNIGLRIDVDTYRGTKLGVPKLCELFDRHSIRGTFFFSVGPDNMGRHLWRLIKPAFLKKMFLSKAASLYGWDIILKGTVWPGPVIGKRLGDIIRATHDAGHEVGLHAWDHHAWQAGIDHMSSDSIHSSLEMGVRMLQQILGFPPSCSAVPGWKCNDAVLIEKSKFSFKYNSDCRGESTFLPIVSGVELSQPQIPVTLPTYDEVVGRDGISDDNYNDYLISQLVPAKLNVLTIHAEVEGISRAAMFVRFIEMAESVGASFVPLETFMSTPPDKYSNIVAKRISGREGWVSCQDDLMEKAV